MADPLITNGVTTLKFRPADLVVFDVPGWHKDQILHDNSAGLPRIHTAGDGRKRILSVALDLERADRGVYAGYDSLLEFYRADNNTGVNGMAQSFMLTDADGDSFQVRFTAPLRLPEGKLDTQFQAVIQLYNEHTLPTDEEAGPDLWVAAYDMDNNGGDLTAWTTTDPVGDTGAEWEDKSGNDHDGSQTTAADRPLYKTGLINGRPAVHFADSTDWLDVNGYAAADFTGADQPITVYAVVNFQGLADEYTIFSLSNSTTANRIIRLKNNFAGARHRFTWQRYDGTTSKTAEKDTDLATFTNYIVTVVDTGTLATVYVNGAGDATGTDVNVGSITLDQATLGAHRDGSAATDSDNLSNGYLGELAVFAGAHSTLERRRQELRLAAMWGIQLVA